MELTGRVWKFGDDINTNLIHPNDAHSLAVADQVKVVFSANRPGWVEQVAKGDMIVAGANFGMGSQRPAARTLLNLGISCLLAHSFNGLFYRNCVNFGLPALECPGIDAAFEEGDRALVEFETGVIRNIRTGQMRQASPMPGDLIAILKAGGIYPLLEKEDLIYPLHKS